MTIFINSKPHFTFFTMQILLVVNYIEATSICCDYVQVEMASSSINIEDNR